MDMSAFTVWPTCYVQNRAGCSGCRSGKRLQSHPGLRPGKKYRLFIHMDLSDRYKYLSGSSEKNKKEIPAEEMPEIPWEDKYQELDLKTALKHLDEKSRTIVMLRYFEDMKLEDISRVVDENLNTVKARLYRALKKLRITMEPEEPKKSYAK